MNTSAQTRNAALLSRTVSGFPTPLLIATALLIASAGAASADALVYTRSGSEPLADATPSFGSHTPATTTSSLNINVPGSFGDVSDVDVRIRLDHSHVRQLRITLEAPNGTTVTLLENGITATGTFLIGTRSAGGLHLTDTVFDGDTFRPITDGTSPYTGRFEADLESLAGSGAEMSGMWKLRVTDYRAGDTGTLINWSITMKNGATKAFEVTNLNDSGSGSLRDAVAKANLNAGHSIIKFAPALPSGTITLTSGPIEVIGTDREVFPVAIGNYEQDRSIDIANGGNGRVFTVSAGRMTLEGVAITGGITTAAEGGGGIFNGGYLQITDCLIRNSVADSDAGTSRGGGIASVGKLSLLRCTFSANGADTGAGLYTSRQSASVRFCTFIGNLAYDEGAGSGGAIRVGSGELKVQSSTIARNKSDGAGGGIATGSSGNVTLLNTIVAQNTAPSGPDLSGEITGSFSLIGNDSGATYSDTGNSKVGTSANPIDPLLGSLGWHGGRTNTLLPLPGSPALDCGKCEGFLAPPGDQRGQPRGSSGIDLLSVPNTSPAGACDMGSVELNPAVFANISTRMEVGLEDDALIGGFIVTAPAASSKKILLRGLGPSLTSAGISDVLDDPFLQLFQQDTALGSNNNWRDSQQAAIAATGIPPSNNLESAMVRTLDPNPYTAVLRGRNSTTGVGLFELYDLEETGRSAVVANISTRGFVRSGNNVMIGGFILVGPDPARILLRGIGPSLANAGIAEPLPDPYLELFDRQGTKIAENDNWQDTQAAAISATGVAPSRPKESALLIDLAAGNYTAVIRGVDGSVGVGLVEAYNIR